MNDTVISIIAALAILVIWYMAIAWVVMLLVGYLHVSGLLGFSIGFGQSLALLGLSTFLFKNGDQKALSNWAESKRQ